MKLLSPDILEPELLTMDFVQPDIITCGELSQNKIKPYIKGHITNGDSTFTFKVNNADTTVIVGTNGNWKYNPTTTLSSLVFVGVPQLESLELFKIEGVSTFNIDYPINVVFKSCDSTTENAKNDVYHIRGTATESFDFALQYVNNNGGTVTVTESAVIDENGKWDVIYSGKKIYSLSSSFKNITEPTLVEITENLDKLTNVYQTFLGTSCSVIMKNATFENLPTETNINMFQSSSGTSYIMPKAVFKVQKYRYFFYQNSNVELIDLSSIDASLCTDITGMLQGNSNLKELKLPNNSSFGASNISFSVCPLTYNSMMRVAGWLKDLTGETALTVTFKKSTYDALTSEQKSNLEDIIITQKGWNLATA